jgi:hypothetical protein
MTTKSLEIKTATIEIKVVRVDGHKMTKATFRQIEHDTSEQVSMDDILGWVADEYIYILWGSSGKIKKRRIRDYDLNGERFGSNTNAPYNLICHIKNNCDQLFIAT